MKLWDTKMLKPADGYEGVVDFILQTVEKAGSKPCPPMIVWSRNRRNNGKGCFNCKRSFTA